MRSTSTPSARLRPLVGEVALVDLGQARPVVEDAGQARQLIARRAIRRLLAEDLGVPGEGALEILELLLVEPRDPLDQHQARAVIVGRLEADLVDAHQRRPVVARDVDRLEHLGGGDALVVVVEVLLERADGAGVRRIAAERGAIVLDGAVGVGELLVVERRQAEAQRHRLVDVVAEAEPPLEQLGQLGVAVRGDVALLERLARVGVVREQLEHLLVGADRLHRPVEVASRTAAPAA